MSGALSGAHIFPKDDRVDDEVSLCGPRFRDVRDRGHSSDVERLGIQVARQEGYTSGLVMRDRPALSLLERDPARARQFEPPADKTEYVEHWYHTIPFPDGEVTSGI